MSAELDPRHRPYRVAVMVLYGLIAAALAGLTAYGVIHEVFFVEAGSADVTPPSATAPAQP